MLKVTTASGKKEKYDPRKIFRTCIRAGASRELADEIVDEVSRNIYDGIPTKKILHMVLESLRQHQADHVASRYDLKSAIMRMGPAGFAFETFLSQVFEAHEYKTRLRQKVRGMCVEHEIDIVLEKDDQRSMVEVKYHNAPGIYTGLKEAMYTYARFLDLSEGYRAGKCEQYDEAWLATNTRSSLEARRFASCRGIRLLGWKYPRKGGLEALIEEKGLYPVTVLHSLDTRSFSALAEAKMLLVQDLVERDPDELSGITGIKLPMVKGFAQQAEQVLSDPLLGSRAEARGKIRTCTEIGKAQ